MCWGSWEHRCPRVSDVKASESSSSVPIRILPTELDAPREIVGPTTTSVDATTGGCHACLMATSPEQEARLDKIKEVRAQAIEHVRQARRLSAERRDLMRSLFDDGLSQADIARALGVSRQAIQKMLAVR